jgi:hypothetical protein
MPASPTPTASTTATELRQDLGVVAYERMQSSTSRGHIGLRLLPPFRVALQSAKFPAVDKSQSMRAADDLRAASGHYNEADWQFAMKSYDTDDRGLEGRIDDRLLAIYGGRIPVEQITTNTLVDRIVLGLERRIAAKLEAGAADDDVGNEWDDSANATPKADVDAGMSAFRLASGLLPNVGACSWKVFKNLLRTKELREALQYTNPIEMGGYEAQRAQLAAYLGLTSIEVGGGLVDGSKKGAAASLADVWDDEYFHLLHVSEGGSNVLEPAYGRTLIWTEGSAGGGSAEDDGEGMLIVETYRDEGRRSDMVRLRYDVAEFEQYADAHYKLGNITS